MSDKKSELSTQLTDLTQLSEPLPCSPISCRIGRTPINILYIEDDGVDQRRLIRVIGNKFESVNIDCLDKAPKDPGVLDDYDALLVDENLPGESGMAFARRLHEHNWLIPKALITGRDLSEPLLFDSKNCVDSTFSKSEENRAKMIVGFSAFIRRIAVYQLLKELQSKS